MVGRIGSGARRVDLSGSAWELTFSPRVDQAAGGLEQAVAAGYRTVPAVVPGSVELDLHRNGLISDPYVGRGCEETWELEYGDWWYRTSFTLPAGWDATRTSLLFHGLDTVADVYVNGRHAGSAANMLIEHELDLASSVRPGENELVVHLDSPLRHAERFDYPAEYMQIWNASESLWVRKPGHMYGWDISPRIVSAGLHRRVELVERAPVALVDWYLHTLEVAPDRSSARLELGYDLSAAPRGAAYELTVEGTHAPSGRTFTARAHPTFTSGRLPITVERPELWFPRNYGEPALYDVVLTLLVDGVPVDRHETRLGIRTLKHDYVAEPAPDGEFRFVVNGVPVMALGTNWVPLDALHARDTERLPAALELLWESGSTMVRCWGGNVYEDTPFYDWCDEHGVLVWQDFALGCGRYPQTEPFLSAVHDEAVSVVKKFRNHACLALWCGSNENDDSYVEAGIDPNTDVVTRQVLPDVVRRHDWWTPYVPGSPAYTTAMVEQRRTRDAPDQHTWGARASFKDPFYARSSARFISEVGFHGCPSDASLSKFIPAGHATVDPSDPVWKLHESDHRRHPTWYYSRIQLMLNQAELFFGVKDFPDRPDLVAASQINQAEALKFVVENVRLAKGEKWGVLWWNLLDCWPQISDAVVDYYFDRKLAFHYLRRSQQPICVIAGEADGWGRDVTLANDSGWTGDVSYRIRAAGRPDVDLSGSVVSPAGQNIPLLRLPVDSSTDCYLFTWRTDDGRTGANHYLTGFPPRDLGTYRKTFLPAIAELDAAGLEMSWT